jgi:DNA-binding SARP family transcriptional activator/WD40 repeat protein
MQIHLLGPVEVSSDNGGVALGGPKPRALLAMLALDAGSTVSAERLIDGLWGDEPPATAGKMVQLYVSQLRKAMAAEGEDQAITTYGRGYQLQLGRDRVDVGRFERLLAQGAAREALSLWRGAALADVADEPFAAAEIRRLEELRASALEVAIDQDLDAGRHREVLPELEALLALEPLRERLHAQRMLALYRSGRQAEALEAYRQARAALVEEVGVEPGPDLRRLQEAILRQDPSLDPPGQAPAGAPLVGRDAELAHLRDLWRRARAGSGASVLVTGPPGIGKTRLVQELAEEVRRDGGTVAYGELEEVHGPTLLVLDDVAQAPEVPPDRPVLAVATATAADGEGETLPLAPLAPDDVAALARYHAGPRAAVEPPVDRLLADSGGVPARVHRAAAAWARAVATQRVGAAAARASTERAEWHLAGDDVATEVVELQTVRERARLARSDAMPACPFKGLASFDVEDAPVFFGRERLVADMIARLPGTRLMGIVGPSGSGKSSALRAGLLAALADGVLPGSERWPQALIRPGARPLAALERATAELPAGERWIVAVDQFEETFTTCRDAAERAAFVDALVACARVAHRRTLVLVAVRADFYGHCARFPELSRQLGANQVLVGPMRGHELRRAIELPAQRAGLKVEPDLVDALLAGVEGRPGALPLLSTSLLELWQHRDGRTLRLADHERAGGVEGAVARLAESGYERLDPRERTLAKRILLRLAGEGEGDNVVRRRVPLKELGGEEAARVLSVLAEARLVTVDEREAEVAHEALLREWPRLRGWLAEDAEGRRLHLHLTRAAADWDAAGRDPAELYRGARLGSALDWAAEHDEHLNELEREFLAAGREEAEHESEHQRATNRRLRTLLAGVAVLLALAVVAGAVALNQRGDARDAALVADAGRVGADAVSRDRLDSAALLARAGVDLHDSPATRGNLLSVLLRTPAAVGVLVGDGWPVWSLAVSDDERFSATGTIRGTVAIFDSRRRRIANYRFPEGYVQHLRFSPDGEVLAITGQPPDVVPDGAPDQLAAVVDLVEPRTGRRLRRIVLPGIRAEGVEFTYGSVAFSADGRTLVVPQIAVPFVAPGRVHRFDARTGESVGAPLRIPTGAGMIAVGPRGRRVVVSGEEMGTSVFDVERFREVKRLRAGHWVAAISPDGGTVALGSDQGFVRLVDVGSGRVRRLGDAHEGHVAGAAFARGGRVLLTSGGDGVIMVRDVARGAVTETFAGHGPQRAQIRLDRSDAIPLVASRDGRTVYSAGPDGRAFAWDVAGDRRLDRQFIVPPFSQTEDQYPPGLAIGPAGRTFAVSESDGFVTLRDTGSLAVRARFRALRGYAAAVAFSPDGRLLAVSGEHGQLTLTDARSLEPVAGLKGMKTSSRAVAFSPDGRLLAAAELGAAGGADEPQPLPTMRREGGPARSVRLWDVRRRTEVRVLSKLPSASIAFSPDGRQLAMSGYDQPVEVREVSTGRLVARLETDDHSRSVAFSPDGRLLVTGDYAGAAQLWETDDFERSGAPLQGHAARIQSIDFTRDGRTFVTAAADGTVQLWDLANRKRVGTALTIDENAFLSAAFAPDSDRLFAVSEFGRGVRWEVSPEAWKRHACAIAGRPMTEREWADALPDRPFRPVCGG